MDIDTIVEKLDNNIEISISEDKFLYDNLSDSEKISLYERHIENNSYNPFYNMGWVEYFTTVEEFYKIKYTTDIMQKYDYFYINELDSTKLDFITEKDLIEECDMESKKYYELVEQYYLGELNI